MIGKLLVLSLVGGCTSTTYCDATLHQICPDGTICDASKLDCPNNNPHACICPSGPSGPPTPSPTPAPPAGNSTAFFTKGRKIFVSTPGGGSELFIIRGFSYSNALIGEGAPNDGDEFAYDAFMHPDRCAQDFALMRSYNVNSIKLYAFNAMNSTVQGLHLKCLDQAWNGGHKPIFVTLSVWIDILPFSSSVEKQLIVQNYATMVNVTRHHPAVWAYSIGSEIGGDPNNNPAYWSDFNIVAKTVRSAMGSYQKLITTGSYQTNGVSPDVPCIGHISNGEKYGAIVDVWGVDVYSPDPDDEDLMENIKKYTTKPFWFPEYGVNFQPSQGKTEEQLSATLYSMAVGLFANTVNLTSSEDSAQVYSGGMMFEWIDEYWKGGHNCYPNPNSAQPWYGVNAVALRSGCTCTTNRTSACKTDLREPRLILTKYVPILFPEYIPRSYS
mmetsp:Transcript_34838/g.68448  ORF Transcript_34838/g.68448 Transcript_34838/m.68448 type:complete len:441 (+) Transcript_34838:23-1345(+)